MCIIMSLKDSVTLTVAWLTMNFSIFYSKITPPTARTVYRAVKEALEEEGALTEAEEIRSLAHLTRSLDKFEPVMVFEKSIMDCEGHENIYHLEAAEPKATLLISIGSQTYLKKVTRLSKQELQVSSSST